MSCSKPISTGFNPHYSPLVCVYAVYMFVIHNRCLCSLCAIEDLNSERISRCPDFISLSDSIFVHSEITAEGRRITKLDQILLNGNNIAIVSIT